jgi:hypothetical protein
VARLVLGARGGGLGAPEAAGEAFLDASEQ